MPAASPARISSPSPRPVVARPHLVGKKISIVERDRDSVHGWQPAGHPRNEHELRARQQQLVTLPEDSSVDLEID